MLPRVGKTFITDHSILERLQKIFPDKEIKRVQAYKGSDRTLPPPRDLVKNEIPYRRAIIVSRTGGMIQVEKEWEYWQDLSHRQQIRPAHPARINITMYACSPQPKSEAPSDSTKQAMSPEATGTIIEPHDMNASPPSNSETPAAESRSDQAEMPEASPSHIDLQSPDHGPKLKTISIEERSFLLIFVEIASELRTPPWAKIVFNATSTRVFTTIVSSCHGLELLRMSEHEGTQASTTIHGQT